MMACRVILKTLKISYRNTYVGLLRRSTNLPLHRELDDCVELAKQSSGSLPNLDVVTVAEAGGGSRRAQLRLSTSLGLLQRQ